MEKYSLRKDPRLTGDGGKKFWPIIRNALLVLAGFLIIWPGGGFVGICLGFAPDNTPHSVFILLGTAANASLALALLLLKKRSHAYALVTPALLVLLVMLLAPVLKIGR